MKKMAKVAALLAAMVLAAGLTACQGKGSSKGLVIEGATVKGFTPDVPAKLSIPKGVSEIGKDAFRECLTLTSVTIPDTVAKIWGHAFSECKNLKSVTISAKDTGYCSFAECTGLENVTIGNGVESINTGSFAGCTSLKNVSIPASVTEIDWSAFVECDSLKEVKYAGTKAQWEAIEKSYYMMDGYTVSFTVHCKDGDVAVEVTK